MFNYRSRTLSNVNSNGSGRDGSATVQTIGSLLRDRREVLGATLAEIEAATKIRQKYLSALESDEWQLLPGEIIGRGFLRNYASYLGLDPAELTERRRAIVDPSVVTILSNTSAGTQLPPERAIDYRPRILDLREDSDVIEGNGVNVGPYFRTLAALLLFALLGWGVLQYGSQIASQASGLYRTTSQRVTALLAMTPAPTRTPTPRPTATPLSSTPIAANVDNNLGVQPTNTPAEVQSITQPETPTSAPVANDFLPTATDTPQPTPTPPAAPTPLPIGVVNQIANIRSGPGTTFPVVGSQQPGDQVQLTELSPDGLWYALGPDRWIFGQLVDVTQATISVAQGGGATETPQAAAATATATPEPPTPPPPPVQQPTPQPVAPAVSAAVCSDPGIAISSPGVNQVVSGALSVSGTANRDPFQYYKIEVNGLFILRQDVPVSGGFLGTVDTTIFSNGPATLVLSSIDQSGNFSTCAVDIMIQN